MRSRAIGLPIDELVGEGFATESVLSDGVVLLGAWRRIQPR